MRAENINPRRRESEGYNKGKTFDEIQMAFDVGLSTSFRDALAEDWKKAADRAWEDRAVRAFESVFGSHEDESSGDPMDWLREHSSEAVFALAQKYYAIEEDALLAPSDVCDRYEELHIDAVNFSDWVDDYGVKVYQDAIAAVEATIPLRQDLARKVSVSLEALGKGTLLKHCYLLAKRKQPMSRTVARLFELRDADEDVLSGQSCDDLESFLGAIRKIDVKQVEQDMAHEAELERRLRKQMDKLSLQSERKRNLERLSHPQGHLLRGILERMGVRRQNGQKILYREHFSEISSDVLREIIENLGKLEKCASEYGVDCHWCSEEDVKFLLDEVFGPEHSEGE
ncbi:MAG: hypothetical protein HGB34_03630 [Candidatus Moranbacteria bacterium]|nr:hypothetical protein [Candidatus Moranbacteria bacterium]